ncbi:MAG: CoA transferase [Betaproteobacteria bacterium]|nr:CoA transferase [Betaproteobacteria bacterium]
MTHQSDSQALRRFKVLDLSRVRSGPTCVRVLTDFGADVLRIESPPGVDANEGGLGGRDTYDMINLHRNKRSITLNLKQPQAKEIFFKLVKDADVVVENFRPDVKFRLGIDYETLAQINPRIILASISGFGEDGPYRTRPGFDQIAQGMGGLMSVTGLPGQGPVRAGIAIADSSTGVFAAMGILIALLERETSGKGQWVQANLLQSMVSLCDFQAARYLIDGVVPEQAGNDHPFATPMGRFASSDGFFNIGVSGTLQFRSLCELIGRLDLRDEPRYQTNPERLVDRALLNDIFAAEFIKHPTDYWVKLLNDAGVPCGPIYNMQQVFEDPQVQHLGIATPVHHPKRGDVKVVSQPIKLSRTPASVTQTQPELGAQNHEVLKSLGYSDAQITEFQQLKVI